ncbi:MAG TPA: hypothetical protein VKH35_14940 [Thermoanaerobaculia bacterium]|nr:hypothetical protein [Thermoanaerobaculia bacterium]
MPDVWSWLARSPFHDRKIDGAFYSDLKMDHHAMRREVMKILKEKERVSLSSSAGRS